MNRRNRNRRFQFSLRSALLLVALLALAIGWWLDHRSLSRQLDDARRKIQFLKTSRYFDGQTTPGRSPQLER